MHFIAKLSQGPIYSKWMKLRRRGGTINGVPFKIVDYARNAYFVSDELDDVDLLKNEPDIVIAMHGAPKPKAKTLNNMYDIDVVADEMAPYIEPVFDYAVDAEDISVKSVRRRRPPKVKDA